MASAAAEKGKSPVDTAESAAASAERLAREWSTWAMKNAKLVAHYGFIPLVILVGMSLTVAILLPGWTDGAVVWYATVAVLIRAPRTRAKPAEYATRVVSLGLTACPRRYPQPLPVYPRHRRPTGSARANLRGMRRDAAVAPAADVASQPIAVETGKAEAVFIYVDVGAAAHGVACRICHLSPEGGDGLATVPGAEVIGLGCDCKEELSHAHRQCAEAWFRIKGDRRCEICGSDTKNITGLEVKRFMEEWHRLTMANTGTVERESTCWRRHPFCNFLLACLLIAFMLPWFFRANIFFF